MQNNEAILQRQRTRLRFKNQDMDFILNWALGASQVVGLSPAQLFYAVQDVKEGDPDGWQCNFNALAADQAQRAHAAQHAGQSELASQYFWGAASAWRLALQFLAPQTSAFAVSAQAMSEAFQAACQAAHVPLRAIEVPFETTSLAGYYLEHDARSRPVIVMVGGGDTFREDLFYFAGYLGWQRGYNVLMVDLPGQGMMPTRGLHFRADMQQSIATLLDWLASNAATPSEDVILYGVSGGGYFSAQSAAVDSRVRAWIAATPIYDVAELFRREFGSALRAPSWLIKAVVTALGTLNRSAEINLQKYAWQFGTSDFKGAVEEVYKQAKSVDYRAITCPSLFLVSEGEAAELKHQTQIIADDMRSRQVDVTVRAFTASEGADAHCQVNNLRLAHQVLFDWLDRRFAAPAR